MTETYTPKREDDFSKFTRFARGYDKWRPLIFLAVAIWLAAGFDFRTPAQQFAALRADLRTVDHLMDVRLLTMGTRLDTAMTARLELQVELRALMRLECTRTSAQQVALSGLPCRELMDGMDRRQYISPGANR